jgi:hypothetical protein
MSDNPRHLPALRKARTGAGSHFIIILEPADIHQKEVVAASLPCQLAVQRHVAA